MAKANIFFLINPGFKAGVIQSDQFLTLAKVYFNLLQSKTATVVKNGTNKAMIYSSLFFFEPSFYFFSDRHLRRISLPLSPTLYFQYTLAKVNIFFLINPGFKAGVNESDQFLALAKVYFNLLQSKTATVVKNGTNKAMIYSSLFFLHPAFISFLIVPVA